MDYTKFFSKITQKRRSNMIRELTERFMTTPDAISLAGGMPNAETYPFKEISVTYKNGLSEKLVGKDLSMALQYGPSKGYPPLRNKLREFQRTWHSPKSNSWDVLLTCGSQDGCSRVFEMLIDQGQPVMIQSPTYTATIGAIVPLEAKVIEISQDEDGIVPENIINVCEQRLRNGELLPKFLYVNPTGANPTGTVLPDYRKKEIYKLAQKYDFLIVEDDPYYFIHFLKKQPTSFFSLDTDGRVIRLDSFSKILSAGIRLGVVTAHEELLNKLNVGIENTTLHASSLSQMIVYKLLDSWGQERFDEQLENVKNFYRNKRNIMLAAVEEHFTGIAEWTEPRGGMFFWIKITVLDDVLDFVMKECISHKVFVLPGHAFYYHCNRPDQHLRLSYSYATVEEIQKAVSFIARLIRKKVSQNNHI